MTDETPTLDPRFTQFDQMGAEDVSLAISTGEFAPAMQRAAVAWFSFRLESAKAEYRAAKKAKRAAKKRLRELQLQEFRARQCALLRD